MNPARKKQLPLTPDLKPSRRDRRRKWTEVTTKEDRERFCISDLSGLLMCPSLPWLMQTDRKSGGLVNVWATKQQPQQSLPVWGWKSHSLKTPVWDTTDLENRHRLTLMFPVIKQGIKQCTIFLCSFLIWAGGRCNGLENGQEWEENDINNF